MCAETSSLLLQPFLVDYILCPSRYGAQASWPAFGMWVIRGRRAETTSSKSGVSVCKKRSLNSLTVLLNVGWHLVQHGLVAVQIKIDLVTGKNCVKSVFFTFGWRRSDQKSFSLLEKLSFFPLMVRPFLLGSGGWIPTVLWNCRCLHLYPGPLSTTLASCPTFCPSGICH